MSFTSITRRDGNEWRSTAFSLLVNKADDQMFQSGREPVWWAAPRTVCRACRTCGPAWCFPGSRKRPTSSEKKRNTTNSTADRKGITSGTTLAYFDVDMVRISAPFRVAWANIFESFLPGRGWWSAGRAPSSTRNGTGSSGSRAAETCTK